MNKKFLGIFAALVVLGSTGAFAGAALGLQGGYAITDAVGSTNIDVTFKLSKSDAVFAADIGLAGNQLYSAALQADWWVANPRLAGMLHYFYGPGLAVGVFGLSSTSSWFGLIADFRAVVGVNIFVIDPLELYLQAAWQPGITFAFTNTTANDSFGFHLVKFPIQFGFRFWF
jgi:hypothetical protein